MSSHHDDHDHPVSETKPVAFRTPLIMALVTVFAILLLVSTCDKKEECCCEGEKCETKCEDKHGEHHGTEAKEEHHDASAAAVTETVAVADSSATTPDTAHVHVEHAGAHH